MLLHCAVRQASMLSLVFCWQFKFRNVLINVLKALSHVSVYQNFSSPAGDIVVVFETQTALQNSDGKILFGGINYCMSI